MNKSYFSFSVISLAVIMLFIAAAAPLSEAAVIGANRGALDFRNVLKNGYSQEFVTLTTDTDFDLSINYQVEGDIKDWVRIEPADNPMFVSRDSPKTVAVIIEPPSDARIERYTGSIRFITGALAGPDAQFGTAVRAAITINFGLQVTGQEILSCSIPQVDMEDVEEGYPLEFSAVVSNTGNVRIRPDFEMEFWNQDQSKLVDTFSIRATEEILPTVQKRVFNSITHDLPIGQYWVKLKTPMCGDAGSQFLTVSVIERGGVSDKGELLGIENSPDAAVGQIVPIDAVFENKGTRIVSAKFKGVVTSGSIDNIFKIIDTEPIDVAPGEIARLRTYFNPTQEGQYLITGQVLYNRKLTFERTSVLNVRQGGVGVSGSGWMSYSGVFVMFIAIIVLVMLIIKKRRKNSNY